jgi:hypothetical protein
MFEANQKHSEKVTLNLTVGQKNELEKLSIASGLSESEIARKLLVSAMVQAVDNPLRKMFELMEG